MNEEEQWAEMAARSREEWCRENPWYGPDTGNPDPGFSITADPPSFPDYDREQTDD